MANTYDINSIEVIDGIGCVQKRPEMYVGDPDSPASLYQMAHFVIINAIDEHLAGSCTSMHVTMHADGSLSVCDNGPGVSLATDEEGTSLLEKVLSKSPLTSKPWPANKPHVLLNPYYSIGIASALSSSLSAEVRQDGQTWRIELERGRVSKKLAMVGSADRSGTTIRFAPDASVFAEPEFVVEKVAYRVRELSALLPRLTMRFSCEGYEYASSGRGVVELLSGHGSTATGDAQHGPSSAQVAFQWSDGSDETHVAAYCNLDAVAEGTHIDGFRQGLADALGREDSAQVYEALAPGLGAVVSVLVIDPAFRCPTYSYLGSKEAFAVVREATMSALEADLALRQYLKARLKTLDSL
ncbi:MAG: hypothetical protein AB8H86_12435 [Polyangiales bacterium]